jgi:hypothetical protein
MWLIFFDPKWNMPEVHELWIDERMLVTIFPVAGENGRTL